MGRGSGPCHKVGGHENPAVAAWALSTSLLAIISLTLLLLGEAKHLTDSAPAGLKPDEYGEVMFVSRATFMGLGVVHAVLFIVSTLVTIAGYFFCPAFLCLACPLAVLSELACLITSSFGGYMLNSAYNYRVDVVDSARIAGSAAPPADFSLSFVDTYASLILLVSVASLACLAPLSRAATIDEHGTMVDVMLHLPVITGCMAMAGMMLFPSRLAQYTILGSAWLVAALVAGILVGLQKWGGFASRISTILIAVFYLLVLILSLACILILGLHFTRGRTQVINFIRTDPNRRPAFLQQMSEEDFKNYKNYMVLNEGGFNLAGVVIASLIFIYSFMGSAFSIRAVFGGSSALTREGETPRRKNVLSV
ncbi:hypothetical protein Efla_000128 [Eimeria flavescens]